MSVAARGVEGRIVATDLTKVFGEVKAVDGLSFRADEVLDLVGLTQAASYPVRGFSLGMRQRLGLATALLGNPRVLLLDEPANGLNPEGIVWLRGLLRHFADVEGRTVLVSSHVLSAVEQTVAES